MAAAKYDFVIEQGSSFKLAFIYRDSLGNPVDLTNWCARLIWKTSTNNIQVFNTSNIDLSVYKFYIDGPEGKVVLMLPASTTNNFTFTDAKYDLELQSPDDLYNGGGKYTVRLLFGTASIRKRNSHSDTNLECNT